MDNPLYNSTFSPPPPHHDGFSNPVFSTRGKSAPTPSTAQRAMRRLSDLNTWDLPPSGDGDAPQNNTLALSPLANTQQPTAPSKQRLEEREFADILTRCMRGEMHAADALLAYADACRARAADLRDIAASQLQRAPRFMALNALADELDAEAATWRLVWHLHGVPGRDFPAGVGGEFVEGAGFAKNFKQHAADLLFQDDALNRAGRTVAWLEALAAEAADKEPAMPFSSNDGLWRETRARLDAGTASRLIPSRDGNTSGGHVTLITELDPDAPTRQKKRLHPDNAKDDDRLMAALWKLIRSGRIAAARQLCEDVGQSWRAVSIGGGGPFGPLPLGVAAAEADIAESGVVGAETLSNEVEGGTGATRALWKWSCYKAAERIGEVGGMTGLGMYEAATYAALAGHLARVLPVCTTWEDKAWAHIRCWLDCAVDRRLGVENPASTPLIAAETLAPSSSAGTTSNNDINNVTLDAVKEMRQVQQRGWPLSVIEDQLPATFEDLILLACGKNSNSVVEATGGGGGIAKQQQQGQDNPQLGVANNNNAPGSAAALRHREVQSALILDKIDSLVRDCLVRWIIDGVSLPSDSQEEQQSQQQLGEAFAEGPACPPGLMRFAAHLALALWALGVATTPEDGAPTAAYSALHDLLQRLVQVYAVHLIDSGAHDLVAPYTCHLRTGLRHATYLLFMEHLVAQGDFEGCRRAYRLGNDWFTAWKGGDIAPHEMANIAEKAVSKAHLESVGGPLNRSWSMRWLCFDSTTTAAAAVRWANALCREFALGGEGGVTAAAEMLTSTIPIAAGSGGLEALLTSAELSGASAEAQELRCWALYYELQTEYLSWQRVVAAVVGEKERNPEQPFPPALIPQTLQLVNAAESFLKDDCLGWLVGPENVQPEAGMPLEIAIVVGPHPGTYNAPPEVLSGHAYPAFDDDEVRRNAAASIAAALQETAAQHGLGGRVTFAAGDAPNTNGISLPGLISVAAECDVSGENTEQGPAAAVLLLSLALKGELLTTENVAPLALAAVNVDAPPALSAALCRCLCFPRIALMCGDLRRAAAEMGHEGLEGRSVVELVANGELAAFFSQKELQLLLVMEKEATVLQMRNEENRKRGGVENRGGEEEPMDQ